MLYPRRYNVKATINTSVPVSTIKDEISSSIGKIITVKEFNRQRKITHQYTGVIIAVYDRVFLLDVNVNKYHLNKSLAYVNFSIGDMEYELN